MIKKQLFFLSTLCIIFASARAQEPTYDYSFFTNSLMDQFYFFSEVKFQAPSFVVQQQNKIPLTKTLFHTPGNALKLQYTNGNCGTWQASIFNQQIRGQDFFAPAKFLSCWMYVDDVSITSADLPAIQLINRDSSVSSQQSFSLTKNKGWQQIVIPLQKFSGADNGNVKSIIGVRFSQNSFKAKSVTIYIDDIEFVSDAGAETIQTVPVISSAKGYSKHVDIEWPGVTDAAVKYIQIYRSQNDGKFSPVGIQTKMINRYADFTGVTGKKYQYRISFLNKNYKESKLSAPAMAETKTMSDDDLLTMVQEACFRYYWEAAEEVSGLAKENILGRHNMIATGASGFGVMALIVGTQRKFISREQSVKRFLQIVNFLEKAETFHGAFSHFIDGPSGKVEPFFGARDNGGDLVETSFLLQGLLTAQEYFDKNNKEEKAIRQSITKIWERIEWDWYRQFADSKFLYWHWSPDKAWIINHRLIGWNETMVTYLLAIASPTHAVPASMYYTGWASQDSFARAYRENWGGTKDGALYKNGKTYFNIKLDVGVSNGGPLFFTQYSYLGYDPHFIKDKYTNYFDNNKNIALINYKYCIENPKKYFNYSDSCWGLTASDGPYNYSADEPVLWQDKGKIAPTGAIGSFPYTPKASMKALKNYYNNYGKFLWGEYGFRDAFNLTENWCSEIYMGLNQAPMVVMIENYRTGLLWKLFMQNEEIKIGLAKIAEQTAE